MITRDEQGRLGNSLYGSVPYAGPSVGNNVASYLIHPTTNSAGNAFPINDSVVLRVGFCDAESYAAAASDPITGMSFTPVGTELILEAEGRFSLPVGDGHPDGKPQSTSRFQNQSSEGVGVEYSGEEGGTGSLRMVMSTDRISRTGRRSRRCCGQR